ncbi:MAG TPA: intradiol ring-cleavage dioxygenase [Gaiellaceae bacterium]|nr:intradiol ring-cleavage dioxygenase [Gaiellaceae bacterium]
MDAQLTRGRLFKLAGGLAAALGFGAVKGSWPAGEQALAADGVTCVLTPEQTEGPYYIAGEKVRRNIAEGRPGTPLTLRMTVVESRTCKPIKGATVDIWHCDASGAYSGFGAGRSSRTFMRGIQRTNASGVAIFKTVYPGWYPGRTVHIHVKVHVRGNVVHTGQLYFSDRVTDAVYRRAPYSGRPNRETRNADDSLFRNGGRRSLLRLQRSAAGYIGSIKMGVRRS